jgi:hypothetical protein
VRATVPPSRYPAAGRPSCRTGPSWLYAHCIDGQADAANQRITDALGAKDTEPGPGGEEDSDSKKAT